jgi:hypothetical protein
VPAGPTFNIQRTNPTNAKAKAKSKRENPKSRFIEAWSFKKIAPAKSYWPLFA